MNKRTEVLQTAMDLVNGDRQSDYGSPKESFSAIANVWSEYLGTGISATDVCNMMALLKIMRLRKGPHLDSFVDGAGYLALGAEMSE